MIWLVGIVVVAAVIVFCVMWMRGRSVERTPDEVANYLRDFIEGAGGEWDWDDFESVPIKDAALERLRLEAIQVGPPDADVARLRELLREAEALAGR